MKTLTDLENQIEELADIIHPDICTGHVPLKYLSAGRRYDVKTYSYSMKLPPDVRDVTVHLRPLLYAVLNAMSSEVFIGYSPKFKEEGFPGPRLPAEWDARKIHLVWRMRPNARQFTDFDTHETRLLVEIRVVLWRE